MFITAYMWSLGVLIAGVSANIQRVSPSAASACRAMPPPAASSGAHATDEG
jgi:hypothetical protein